MIMLSNGRGAAGGDGRHLGCSGVVKGRGYIANQVIQHKLIFSVCVNQNAC